MDSEIRFLPLHSTYLQRHIFLAFITLLQFTQTLTLDTFSTSFGRNETDHLALLAFKSSITLDPEGLLRSWNNSFDFCEWEGVTCGHRHRRVTVLNLASRGLVGSLSPYIGNLSFLMEIRLSNNTFKGKIPPQIGHLKRLKRLSLYSNSIEGEIPVNLSRCSNLDYLHLGLNMLVGKIPEELNLLSKFTFLAIQGNNLTGTIPPSLGNITSLEVISAAGNLLMGTIPVSLSQLKNLTVLGFGDNKLSGTIPPSIYNLSSLTILSFPQNQLHGSLPPGLGFLLPHLQYLQLSDNQFAGPLPVSLSNMSELQRIDIHNNRFNGKIAIDFAGLQTLILLALGYNDFGSGEPDEMNFLGSLTNCTNLVGLDLKDNQLRGALQNNVGNLSAQLFYLSLDGNQIYGDIPSTIGYLVNVETLGLAYNQFTGRIPTNVVNLQKLQRLFVSDNKLSGKIPDSIGNLSLLNELYLGNNRLEGTIPSSLGSCQQLLLLELDQNNLNGTIPRQLFDLSTLSISLNLARNHLSGLIPIQLGNLKNLAQLDLSENQLSGEIPSSLGSCTSLEYLYLEGNFFQGSIPSSLSSLKGIQNFDLSHNNFSGQIPVYLEYFSLKILNLSFNDFEGEVPTKGVFANASAISITGNKRLCGGISELQLPKCPINESQKKKMSVARLIMIIIITTSATTGVILVTCLIFCWFKKKQRNMPSGSLLRRSLLKVSYGELFKATDGFSSENLIGAGHFGSVYKGIVDKDGSIVAIKVLNLLNREASKSFMAECEALRNIRHRNLVKTITSCSTIDFQGNAFKALVYEFMPNGSLERWLHSCMETDDGQDKIQKLNLLERINIAIDVACALDYLHNHCQKPIVHCDLKPANILLDSDMTAHVGDFGLSRFLPQLMNPNESSSMGIRGTVGYAAPEYGLGNEVSTSGDVYSYGILLLEMMTGRRPTDPMFEGGLNLHSFARIALPDRVLEIVDPTLLNNDDSEAQAEAEEAKNFTLLVPESIFFFKASSKPNNKIKYLFQGKTLNRLVALLLIITY
ncbi:hypothetical protein ACSBR1_007819 [Camellia fascicularis]